MPVNSTHQDYDKHLPIWARCRDAIAGEESIKSRGELYLPKLGGQDVGEYKAYLTRAYFYNAVGRTHEAMLGTLFRIDPAIAPEPTNKRPLVRMAIRASSEVIAVGRCGLLVDAPINGGAPYITLYVAEDIINWQTARVDDNDVLLRVVLRETVSSADPKDPYLMVAEDQYRELYLDEFGRYAMQLWVDGGKGEYVKDGDPVYPTSAGNAIDSIPFVFIGPDNNESAIPDPPLLDLVAVNLSHYRSTADLEHGRHYTALPTAWVAGFDTDKELTIGSATAWVTDNVNARAGFLEFTGQGLGALERAIEQKEAQMAMLGMQLMASSGNTETATAARIHMQQQTASLSSIADAVSNGMTVSYQYMLQMMRSAETAVVRISKDFMPDTMDGPTLTALVSTYQQGAMSLETLLWNMKQGELLPPDVSPEDEQARIAAGVDRMAGAGLGG
jgi:hypothetical protein